MTRRIVSALGTAALMAAVVTGCASSSHPATQTQGTQSQGTASTSSQSSQPTAQPTCNMPGADSAVPGLPACETQAPDYPPTPSSSPAGFQRLTYSHEPGPVPQQASLTLTRPDGVKVELTLENVDGAAGAAGARASIGIRAEPSTQQPKWQTVTDGATVTEAGFTFHVLKIWAMDTPWTDAVDLTATPTG